MKNFVRNIAAVAVIAIAPVSAMAEELQWDGSVSTFCSFSDLTPGALDISGSDFTTTTPASFTMTQNVPGGYRLSAAAVNLASAPAGMTLGSTTSTYSFVAGPNAGTGAEGSFLDNAGADSIEATVQGSFGSIAAAGSYTMTQTIQCIGG